MSENNKAQLAILKSQGEVLSQLKVSDGKGDEPITLSKAIENFIKDNIDEINVYLEQFIIRVLGDSR